MKDKDEKKPLGGTVGAVKPEPEAPKQETPGAADKAAEDPGAGKEEEKKPDAPTAEESTEDALADEKAAGGKVPGDGANGAAADAQNGAEGADVDLGKSTENSEDDAGSDTEPGATAADVGSEDPEKDVLRLELLAARSQLAAYGAGVAPEMIADAVTLATAEAQAAGDVSAESIAKAMEGVLKRHPEWKAGDPGRAGGDGSGGEKSAGAGPAGDPSRAGGPARAGGFKLGVDPGGVSSSGGEAKSAKRWNRFK